MSGHKVLCVVVTLDGYGRTAESVKQQTYPVSKLVIADKPFPQLQSIGERTGMAMRHALSREQLDNFTHILRVDGDTILPKNFVKESLKLNADLVGCGGYAQLLKTSTFKDLFDNTYPVDFAEDTVLAEAVIRSPNHVYSKYVVKPITSAPKRYPITSWIKNGEFRYKNGIPFLLTCLSFRDYRSSTLVGFNSILIVMGFLRAKVRANSC